MQIDAIDVRLMLLVDTFVFTAGQSVFRFAMRHRRAARVGRGSAGTALPGDYSWLYCTLNLLLINLSTLFV